MCCRSDFNSVSARLPCYLSKGRLKQDSLGIYQSTFFGSRKFKNTLVITVIFFLKMFKNESKFTKLKKKKKFFFVSEIIASENVAINFLC